jgi:RNA polymerase sigma factor (sigma-70 family)
MVDPLGDLGVCFDQEFPRIYNYVRYRCGDADLADDLTAQAFERALERLDRYSAERGSFHNWMMAIAHNLVCNHFRSERLRRFLPWEQAAEHADPGLPPEDQVIGNERRRQAERALHLLSEREREIVALKFGGGLTNAEISGLTGLNANHVGVILCRALQKVERELRCLEGMDG